MQRATRRIAYLSLLLCGFLAAPASAQGGASFYEPKDTWAETMEASRAKYRADETAIAVELGPWWATAPLPAPEFSLVLFPEEGVDLEAVDEDGKPRWKKHPQWVDGAVRNLPQLDYAHTYLYRTVTAAQATTVTGSFGSDDGIAIWLNGERLLSHDVPRGPAPDQELVELAFHAGTNHLLVKIHNNAGGHAFYFSLRENPLVPLWSAIAGDFPGEAAWMTRDLPRNDHLAWFDEGEDFAVSRQLVAKLAKSLGVRGGYLAAIHTELASSETGRRASEGGTEGWLDFYTQLCATREDLDRLQSLDMTALRRAIEDLTHTYPDTYAPGEDLLGWIDGLEVSVEGLRRDLVQGSTDEAARARATITALRVARHHALLANPLLDFDRLLAVKRTAGGANLGLPQNWQGNCSLPRSGFEDEVVTMNPQAGVDSLTAFFTPVTPRMIADVDLHFDADRMLFSMPDDARKWQVWELGADGGGLRQVTTSEHPAIDNYDACYLPDGRILFDSTRVFQGIPCVGGADAVANLFLLDEAKGTTRQLCFDQDHDWCPVVLNNGRVMYERWEYSDTPHYFTRLLFHMNPDGTGQTEYYGSNSFWPNSLFYARPIPDHPTKFVGIVGGHHGVPRMGELVVFDPAQGRFEADGVVQRIPGFGEKVEPIIADQLVDASWPKFLHPYPLSEKYFLVSAQPTPNDLWGIYLVDVFDNMTLLAELPGFALMEPIPFRPTKKPPVIPDRVDVARTDATIYLTDIYAGPGLAGVPKDTVKELRVYEFHYAYPEMGGHKNVGVEGGWDVHRILGTVPVEEDGSAAFTVPANTPLAIQPLDEEGRAVALMRSWLTAMPGETLSCVGCHESQNSSPAVRPTIAGRQAPRDIEPWHGPTRGFSFTREVQPVLDRHCVACHNGAPGEDGVVPPLDLSRKAENGWGNFTPSYLALHPYVRRPGPESDYHLLEPLEFHANTSELVQLLEKGHYGVTLDEEAWDRLVTWIDLNVPDKGTWGEHRGIGADYQAARATMQACYANRPNDVETDSAADLEGYAAVEPLLPTPPLAPPLGDTECAGWPFAADIARAKQAQGPAPTPFALDLGDGVTMSFAYVPGGEFLLGDASGFADELPRTKVDVEGFYLGTLEVTRGQYGRFDPDHHNGYHDQQHKDHTTPGYPANDAAKPVIRVTWREAMDFCDWLTKTTGHTCTLPTEAQWEWACRAGADSPLAFGDLDTDFAPYANLADASIRLLAVTGVNPQPIANPSPFEDFLPKEARFDDGERLMAKAGKYAPNAWGLFDMHGNVWEWTRSKYVPYPYADSDGRNALDGDEERVVRGGSWSDRPRYARAAYRLPYRPYQPVHNVGFRVMISAKDHGQTPR